MKKVVLLNMPFAALDSPPLGLIQLKSVVDAGFAGRVDCRVLYPNLDFARWLGGIDSYVGAIDLEGLTSGIGEWFFRQSAFPDAPDNTEDYFRRYRFGGAEAAGAVRRIVEDRRPHLDAFLDGLIDAHGLDQADMVGFTSFFAQNVASLAMALRLKRRRPDLVTIIGGPNCESVMGQTLVREVPQLDWVFSGPALVSFPRFLEAWLEGRADDTAIDGVFSRGNGAGWRAGTIAAIGRDRPLDEVVELDYEPFLAAVETAFPDGAIKPLLFFETSRGCWWGQRSHCSFCGLNGDSMGFRAMRPDLAVPYIRSLFRWAGRARRFDAVDNIIPKSYLAEVLPELDTPAGAGLFYEVRADLSPDDLAGLAKAGVRVVQPGIEALNTGTLKLMGKGTTAFNNLGFLKSCLGHDVFPIWNLLVGFPGEGPEPYAKYVEDMPALVHLPPPGGVFPVRFDRFSPYFHKAAEYGLTLTPFDYYGLTYPFAEDAVASLAYYFMDDSGDAEYLRHVNHWLPELRRAFAAWHARWYAPGELPPPRLHRLPDGRVHDSRFGAVELHTLSAAEDSLLRHLDKPAGRSALPEALAGAVDGLLSRRLLFAEGGRLMSLVLATEPPRPSFERLPKPAAEMPGLVRRNRVARGA